MPRKVTQDDVARVAGVTRSVVSYVLNGNSRAVAPETRERIIRAMDELGYRPNKFAQSLGTGKTNPLASRQIGIVLNNASVFLRPYYAEIIAGIHAKAHEEGYHIRFIRFFDELKDPLLFNSLIHNEEVCGMILLALDQSIKCPADQQIIEQMKSRISNVVCVEWQYPGLSSVSFNRQEAALLTTRHLLERGYKEIAYIGETDERTVGFRQAMIEAGCTDLASLVVLAANDMESGINQAAALLPVQTGIRAIVAGSDEVAIGILRYLNQHGISVPSAMALASIDNLEVAAYTSPPLTTVNVQKTNMGRQAVNLVISRDKSEDHDPVTLLLPCSLVVRESSGPA